MSGGEVWTVQHRHVWAPPTGCGGRDPLGVGPWWGVVVVVVVVAVRVGEVGQHTLKSVATVIPSSLMMR